MKTAHGLRISVFLLAAVFSAACSKQAPRGPSLPAGAVPNRVEVIYAAGEVSATGASGTAAVQIGDFLTQGQSVKTGAQSDCELQLGNKSAIRIEENTEVLLDEILLKPGETNIGIRAVLGTVLCKVDKLTDGERFRLRTPSAVCSVRGTEFSVTVSANNDTLLAVKQGKVAMLPASLDMDKLTAELKTEDPEVAAALEELGKLELVVEDAQEAVVTEAAFKQVEESVKGVESEIKLISGKKPSAVEKEKFRTAVRKAAADVRGSVTAPKPMKEEQIKTLQRIEELKSRVPEEPPAQTEKDSGIQIAAAPPDVEMGKDERTPEEAGTALLIWVRQADESPSIAYMRALENEFRQRNPDSELNWAVLKAETFEQEIQAALASGRGPDIFQTNGGEFLRNLAAAGRLLDVTGELSRIPASNAARSVMSFNGRLYGVAPVFSVAGLFFNQGIFGKLKLEIPVNLAKLEKAANALMAEGIQPFACGAGDQWPILATYMYLVNRFGGDAYERIKERRMGFNSEPLLKAGQKIKEWAEMGFFGGNPLGETYMTATELMKTGRAGMMVSGSWLCKEFSDRNQTDQAFGFRPFPLVIGGMGEIGDVMGMTDIGFAANKSAEFKRGAVVRFFEYAMSLEAFRADPGLIYSVPGVRAIPPLVAAGNEFFTRANTVQLWWDQDLPPMLRAPLLDTIKSFLAPETNVGDALMRYEELLAENMGPVQ